jgi:hypothetical protein
MSVQERFPSSNIRELTKETRRDFEKRVTSIGAFRDLEALIYQMRVSRPCDFGGTGAIGKCCLTTRGQSETG